MALVGGLLAACGAPPPAAPKNPMALQEGCAVPADQRVLRARLEIERGQGSLAIDGQSGGHCSIFALTPGEHRVSVQATSEAAFGIAAALDAFADGQKYQVFDLRCGAPGSCDTVTLRQWQKDVEQNRNSMTDPCAALKVTNVHWESQQLDEYHPKALTVTFALHVYSKPSGKPPRDPSCPDR
jgi:hypothetical protein